MTTVAFSLNGKRRLIDCEPTQTLLDWLREEEGLTGTKEGCNEGDCGACTVMVQDKNGARALNACILFLPQIDGHAVTTVEGLRAPDGQLHPAQEALIAHHGSQCGFCTPGVAMSMATAHLNEATDHKDQLAGNLCRCTGYAPILKAAKTIEGKPAPEHLATPALLAATSETHLRSSDEIAEWYLENPTGTLIAGGTDVGLWVTKEFRALGDVAFIGQADDLREIRISDTEIWIGACATIADLRRALRPHHAHFADMLKRYGSEQVRNAATIGGNIANGSPIGDSPPALIALGATLHLRRGDQRRSMPLESFFIEYGKQDRSLGEFVEAVTFARQADDLCVYKVSKRFDQDISSVCGAINIKRENGIITSARIAFGGMAGIPKCAASVETALIDQPWDELTFTRAAKIFAENFSPMTDHRASAEYRLACAENMLLRFFAEKSGQLTDLRAVVT